MTPPWISHLVRARQSQEDSASQRLAFARRAQTRAREQARKESARVEAMTAQKNAADAGAFVAAVVALQSAAATHAAAVGEVVRADTWVMERQRQLTDAAISRQAAEKLRDDAQNEAIAAAVRTEVRALDEAAAVTFERRRRGES